MSLKLLKNCLTVLVIVIVFQLTGDMKSISASEDFAIPDEWPPHAPMKVGVLTNQDGSIIKELDCGSLIGISLPCWLDYLDKDSSEGSESLPYYPYAKRPNGCSIPGAKPGANDDVNILGINISFTEICNEHDKCYYSLGTFPTLCNTVFVTKKELRCLEEARNHAVTGLDILTLGGRKLSVGLLCGAKGFLIGLPVSVMQYQYHSEAQQSQREYLNRIKMYIEEETGTTIESIYDLPEKGDPCDKPFKMSTVYVNSQSTSDCQYGTKTTPFDTFEQAIDMAIPGGTVIIEEGVYSEKLLIDKAVSIRSDGGAVEIGPISQ